MTGKILKVLALLAVASTFVSPEVAAQEWLPDSEDVREVAKDVNETLKLSFPGSKSRDSFGLASPKYGLVGEIELFREEEIFLIFGAGREPGNVAAMALQYRFSL